MPFPTSGQIISRIKNTISQSIPTLDTTNNSSLLNIMITAFSYLFADIFKAILEEQKKYISSFGSQVIPRKLASFSTGEMVFRVSVLGESIPANTRILSGENIYETQNESSPTILLYSLRIDSHLNGTVTVTTRDPLNTQDVNHKFYSGLIVNISDFNDTEYNNSNAIVNVINETSFSYTLPIIPSQDATGEIGIASNGFHIINAKATESGRKFNLDVNTPVTLVTRIAGVNSNGGVPYPGVTGGSDDETEENYQKRIETFITKPAIGFNANQIINIALEQPNITRCFVITNRVAADKGTVDIYPITDRQGSRSIKTDTGALESLENILRDIAPSVIDKDSINVRQATEVPVDIKIDSVIPNTETMKSALGRMHNDFFKQKLDLHTNFTLDAYKVFMSATVSEGGDSLQAIGYSPDNPESVAIDIDEIGIAGEIEIGGRPY